MAIDPVSFTMSTNNTGLATELVPRALAGTEPLNNFVGGTLLRVIVTIEHSPVITFPAAADNGFVTEHHGLFVDDELFSAGLSAASPWNPNIPTGSFMARASMAYRCVASTTDDMFHETWSQTVVPGGQQQTMFDTKIRRRIHENDKLWLATWHFEDGVVVTDMEHGITGRILIRLP